MVLTSSTDVVNFFSSINFSFYFSRPSPHLVWSSRLTSWSCFAFLPHVGLSATKLLISDLNMHEVITLQFGQKANYVGTHFWNAQVSLPVPATLPALPICGRTEDHGDRNDLRKQSTLQRTARVSLEQRLIGSRSGNIFHVWRWRRISGRSWHPFSTWTLGRWHRDVHSSRTNIWSERRIRYFEER